VVTSNYDYCYTYVVGYHVAVLPMSTHNDRVFCCAVHISVKLLTTLLFHTHTQVRLYDSGHLIDWLIFIMCTQQSVMYIH